MKMIKIYCHTRDERCQNRCTYFERPATMGKHWLGQLFK